MVFNLTCATWATRLYHRIRLLPVNPMRKEILRGIVLNTEATEIRLFRVIRNNVGNCCLRVRLPTQQSSQNLMQTFVLYVYILNFQPTLILWLTYNVPSCQSIFLFLLVALPIESGSVIIYLPKNSFRDFKKR
jgi:hypothetical protein